MRVIHVISALQLGGAEGVAANLATGLTESGHSVVVVTARRSPSDDAVSQSLKARLLDAGVELKDLSTGSRILDPFACAYGIAKLYGAWDADVVHAHTDVPELMVSLATRLNSSMHLARTIHNTELWPTHRHIGRLSEASFQTDLVVYTNADTLAAYEGLRARYGLAASPLTRQIKYGFASPMVDRLSAQRHLVHDYQADPQRFQFGFAGRLVQQKGVDTLLDAVDLLPEPYRNRTQVHIFGDGQERPKIVDAIARKTLPVVLHSPVAEVHRLFPGFDCMIVPSRYEGVGMVAVESLCQGIPVIVTAAAGLKEAVPPWWPLIAPVEESDALAKLMMEVLDRSRDLGEMTTRGQLWATKEYSLREMVQRHEQAYEDLISNAPQTRHRRLATGTG